MLNNNNNNNNIIQHKTTNAVTIGEDATRVISRVERCVGFVLPLSENGLPLIDSFFLVVSFDMFATTKYAYVFMAQPLAQNTPAFCLACFGTDNKLFFVLMKAYITILVAL